MYHCTFNFVRRSLRWITIKYFSTSELYWHSSLFNVNSEQHAGSRLQPLLNCQIWGRSIPSTETIHRCIWTFLGNPYQNISWCRAKLFGPQRGDFAKYPLTEKCHEGKMSTDTYRNWKHTHQSETLKYPQVRQNDLLPEMRNSCSKAEKKKVTMTPVSLEPPAETRGR